VKPHRETKESRTLIPIQRPNRQLNGEEHELVERLRAGDERAFEAFADSYLPGLYRFASARLAWDRELTRDIVQTTVCRAIEKFDGYRGEAPLFTWLCACCRNEIAGHYRRQSRRPTELELNEEAAHTPSGPGGSTPASPEQQLLDSESMNLVHLALDHLPAHYSRALEWKYLEGLSVKEIAWRMKVGPKAAESLLTRARQAFRGVYEQLEEGVSTSFRAEASLGMGVES
jgi:RNA polymerase sigma-70 factor (ECF subfamily)